MDLSELVALKDAYQESEANLAKLLNGLLSPGLTVSPRLATGDETMPLVFIMQMEKIFPDT
ncbi:MAG: hypothetical protein ACTS73_04380 [Arsenophonus sp. NEOnobi-MAG3]